MFVSRSLSRRVTAPLAASLVLATVLSGPAIAAQAQVPVAPLPIREAVQAAWRHHPSYRATEAQLVASRARLEAAGQPLYNPELEVSADDEGPDRTLTAGVNLTLALSGKRGVRRAAAAARLDQATAQARLRRRDFVEQWFTGWAQLQAAQQRVLAGERRVELLTRFASLADRQFAAGDISGLERDLAYLARDEAQVEQSRLLADRAEAEAAFRAVGGIPQSLAAATLPSDGLPPPVPVDPAVLDRSPELQVAQAAALAAEREIAVARRNRIADPTVGLYGGQVDYGGLSDNVVGVSVSIPLFVRNSYRAEVVAAEADAAAAEAEVQRVRMDLEAGRQRATESYAAAREAWSRWTSSRGTDVQRRTDLLERLWHQGELSTADYLLQLGQTLDTQLAGAELEARLWRNYTGYLATTGQLERWSGLGATP